MEIMMPTVKERVLLIAGHANKSKIEFFRDLGLSYASFKGEQKKSGLSSDALLKIFSRYPEIDPTWLLLGQGEMLRSETNKETMQNLAKEGREDQRKDISTMSSVELQREIYTSFQKLSKLITEQGVSVLDLAKRVEALEKGGKVNKKKKKKKSKK